MAVTFRGLIRFEGAPRVRTALLLVVVHLEALVKLAGLPQRLVQPTRRENHEFGASRFGTRMKYKELRRFGDGVVL
jgi:hypothetical protein